VEMGYINGILRSWHKDGIKTLKDIEDSEKKPRKTKSKKSQSKDFTEREYDYDDLERKLLGWDK